MNMSYPSTASVKLFNEVDVREEIICPLLKELGYAAGTNKNIKRELPLIYNQSHLGRKKPEKDPVLRGKADYVLEIDNQVRWVLEVKSPKEAVDSDVVEQAYSYAVHSAVRAVWFLIFNGIEFRLCLTSASPNAAPCFQQSYCEFLKSPDSIKRILSPDYILREFSRKIDLGKPLGAGLGSLENIQSGRITITSESPSLGLMTNVNFAILNGSVFRNSDNKIVAYLSSLSPSEEWQRLNKLAGLSDFVMICDDECISSDKSRPSEFRLEMKKILFRSIYQEVFPSSDFSYLPEQFEVVSVTTARGILSGRVFGGIFLSQIKYPALGFDIELKGDFEIWLS